MFASLYRLIFGATLFTALVSPRPVFAQEDKKPPVLDNKQATILLLQKAEDEYRNFFKRPETVLEFWAAMKFEIAVGKFDLAALHLKLLLEKQPPEDADKELLKIEAAEGMSAFFRLQGMRKWSDHPPFHKEAEKNVEILINRVTEAVEKNLADPVRISKYIKNLDAATPEERTYAFVQLNRSRGRAVPYYVEALQVSAGKPLHTRLVEAMVRLDRDIVPPLLEVFKARNVQDAQAPDLRMTLLDIIHRRGDTRVIPYLWHLSSAAQYPQQVRDKARETLAFLLETDAAKLPPAKMALAEMAEGYYQHKIRFADPKRVRIWPWDGQKLAVGPITLTADQAEEFFGTRYAREALDLDPKYQPAQVAFLNLTLERTLGPQLDQFLAKKSPPAVHHLLATIDTDLVMTVLARALVEDNYPIILATVQALGERGEVRAARLSSEGGLRGVIKALHYPDRRVQWTALHAMLRMPAGQPPVASQRIVEMLRRYLAADPAVAKALLVYTPPDKANEARRITQAAGFVPVLARDVKEAVVKLHESADFDLIVLHHTTPERELPYILTQLRRDSDGGLLPIFIFTPLDRQENLLKIARRHKNTWVLPEVLLTTPEQLKETLEGHLKEASGARLTAAERKEFPKVAMDILWRMARGEITGYDIRPAQDAIVNALRSEDLAVEAIEILGRLPGADVQQRLAGVVLDPARGKLRLAAALELNRHIQKHGLALGKVQIIDVKAAHQNPAEDAALRAQLAVVVGSMRPSVQATGQRLLDFRPDPPPPPKNGKQKGAP